MKTLYQRFSGWLWVAQQHYWLPLVWLLLSSLVLLPGCGWWQGIDVKIRPGGHPDTKPPIVQPQPPPPPKDDWAPPWFRRPPSKGS